MIPASPHVLHLVWVALALAAAASVHAGNITVTGKVVAREPSTVNPKLATGAVERALLSAAKKRLGPLREMRVSIDPVKGDMRVFTALDAAADEAVAFGRQAVTQADPRLPVVRGREDPELGPGEEELGLHVVLDDGPHPPALGQVTCALQRQWKKHSSRQELPVRS